MLDSGNPALSEQLLEPALRAEPDNPEIWFLLGLTRQANRDERGAAEAFSRCAEIDPTKPRPLLELGKSLTALKEFDAAKQAFEAGLLLSNDRVVRRNIRKYLAVIEDNRALSYWVSARMQPDSNPSISSGRKSVSIGGLPFELNSRQATKGSVGIGVIAGLRYAPWISDTVRIATDLGYNGTRFFGSCCNDETWSAAVGPIFYLGSFQITQQVYHRLRLYQDKSYSSEDGVRLDTKYQQPGYILNLGGEFGRSNLIGFKAIGSAARGSIGIAVPVVGSLTIGTTVRFERNSYRITSQSFSAPSIEARASFLGPWDLPTNVWAAALYRRYDSATLTSSGPRADLYWAAGFSWDLDFINVAGMSPSVGIAYETQASNDPLGRFNRLKALIGISRVF